MTTYTKIVDPGGSGDYTSLSAWEAGEQTLYASGDIAIADVRRTTSAKDTTAVTISGWTTGVIPKIIVNSAYRHQGKWEDQIGGTGNYIATLSPVSTSACITISVSQAGVDGILIDCLGSGNYFNIGISHTTQSGIEILNSIIRNSHSASSTSGTPYGILLGTTTTTYDNIVRNVALQGFSKTSGGGTALKVAYGNNRIDNVTVYGSDIGISRTAGNAYIRNTAVFNCTTCFSGTFGSSSNNVSSDATAPGTTVTTGQTAYTDYFTSPSTGDFTLKASSQTLWGIASANLTSIFTTDIDGESRPDSDQFGIGPDYKATSGGATLEETISIDALLQNTGMAKSASLDSLIQKSQISSLLSDSILQKTISAVTSIDALASLIGSKNISVDSLIQISRANLLSIDSIIQSSLSSSFVFGALVQKSLSSGVSIDAVMQGVISRTVSLDAILIEMTGTVSSLEFNALIQKIQTKGISLDALIYQSKIDSISLDVLISLIGVKSISLDVLVQATGRKNLSLDAFVSIARENSVSLDTILAYFKSVETNIDSILWKSEFAPLTLDSLIYLGGETIGLSLDAILEYVSRPDPRGTISSLGRPKIITSFGRSKIINAFNRNRTIQN